jgi:BirA family transcriptional regulator, biotin operon repressor / biotin---[acetyl-CoA-carboxylase] ligase
MGKNLVYVPVCHSTNTLAVEMSSKTSLPEGTLIITDNQQAGKGQRGNGWEAEPTKNLTFSLILKPLFLPIGKQFGLNQCISIAIIDFIKELIPQEIKIKWPNDILIHNQKVCGILIENSLSGELIQQSIIGIGLNVNQQKFEALRASSLSLISKNEYSLSGILDKLLEHIEARYLQLMRGEYDNIQADYLDHLYRINESHQYHDFEKPFKGIITGLDERGRLKVKADFERVFEAKEIKFIY